MPLHRLVLGAGLVAVWFLLFELIEQRLLKERAGARHFRASWKVYVADAVLFTLFAALWFASLGHGGWLLLFLMLGLLVEGPAQYRHGNRDGGRRIGLRLALGLVRTIGAGGILAVLLR